MKKIYFILDLSKILEIKMAMGFAVSLQNILSNMEYIFILYYIYIYALECQYK